MTIDDSIKIISAATSFLNTIAWPLVVLWIVHKFAPLLRDFLANMTEGTLKAFGIEANAKRNATVEMVKADLKRSVNNEKSNLELLTTAGNSLRQADAVTHLLPVRDMKGKLVLWVDDQPEDTFYERRTLEELGLDLDVYTNTEGAIDTLSKADYDVVVIVPPHILPSERGEELLALMNKREATFIIYVQTEELGFNEYPGAYAVVHKTSDLVLQVSSAVLGLYGSDAMQHYVSFREAMRNYYERSKSRRR